MKKKLLCAVLPMMFLIASLGGCSNQTEPVNNGGNGGNSGNSGNNSTQIVTNANMSDEQRTNLQSQYMNFSMNLLSRAGEEDQNVLVSPFSVSMALNMLAQGAEGQTFDEIAALLGQGASKEELATYAAGRIREIGGDKDVHIANSLWVDENHLKSYNTTLNKNFTKTLDKSFGIETDIHAFSPDETTRKINNWVDKNTSGMIDKIIEPDAIDNNSFAYIINAISFEKKWLIPFEGLAVNKNGTFTNSLGEKETVKMMSDFEYNYYENELAIGFLKEYEGCEYGFLAILPKDEEGSIRQFLEEFDGTWYESFVASHNAESVWVKMPAFTYDYDKELRGTLQDMGMNAAFNPEEADLSGMLEDGKPELYVSRVLHKTHIELDEDGTKAAAVTAIEARQESVFIPDAAKEITLDRPFVYAIVDMKTNEPIFLGSVNHVN